MDVADVCQREPLPFPAGAPPRETEEIVLTRAMLNTASLEAYKTLELQLKTIIAEDHYEWRMKERERNPEIDPREERIIRARAVFHAASCLLVGTSPSEDAIQGNMPRAREERRYELESLDWSHAAGRIDTILRHGEATVGLRLANAAALREALGMNPASKVESIRPVPKTASAVVEAGTLVAA